MKVLDVTWELYPRITSQTPSVMAVEVAARGEVDAQEGKGSGACRREGVDVPVEKAPRVESGHLNTTQGLAMF